MQAQSVKWLLNCVTPVCQRDATKNKLVGGGGDLTSIYSASCNVSEIDIN